MMKLEKAGYRLNPKKAEFFRNEIEWVGHKTEQNRSTRNSTTTGQIASNHLNQHTQKWKRA